MTIQTFLKLKASGAFHHKNGKVNWDAIEVFIQRALKPKPIRPWNAKLSAMAKELHKDRIDTANVYKLAREGRE